MTGTLFDMALPPGAWVLSIVCGALIGLAKTGLSGAAMLVIPIMAGLFGGRLSAGLVLPMLSVGDIIGVSWYHRHAQFRYILRLLPWALAGIVCGVVFGAAVSDQQFKHMIGIIILISIAVMIWRERRGAESRIPDRWWFSACVGLVGGFATMVGNSAGPVMAVYLLSMRLPKNAYIGTAAWFFMIVNLLKIPFHVFVWGSITLDTLRFNLTLVPAILAGAAAGIWIIRRIPEKPFRMFIIAMTVLAAIRLFL